MEAKHIDQIISSFLSLPDSPSLSSPLSIQSSFDRVLEKLFEASDDDDDSVQERLTERGLQLAYLLHDSTLRFSRKHATLKNSKMWPLPRELTIKVFSKLDTKSLMQASACCTMFNNYAIDPLCYSHLDFTMASEGRVNDELVGSMINHAGKELISLKVGHSPCSDESNDGFICYWLTGSCLAQLSFNHSFIGNLMESIHLYNLRHLDEESVCEGLLACPNLTDLKIVGLNIYPIDNVLASLTRKCEHLFIETEFKSGSLSDLNPMTPLWRNCPDLTSVSLIGFSLIDLEASLLVKNLRKLKYLNLSRSLGIIGSFLSDDYGDTLLETLILRDCEYLDEDCIIPFLGILLGGDFRFIKHIEISHKRGLFSDVGKDCLPKILLEMLKEKRPDLTFVIEFASPSSSSSFGDASSCGN